LDVELKGKRVLSEVKGWILSVGERWMLKKG
jgi:hypothetical protein